MDLTRLQKSNSLFQHMPVEIAAEFKIMGEHWLFSLQLIQAEIDFGWPDYCTMPY